MAKTTKKPSYAPEIPERSKTKKTTTSKRSTTSKDSTKSSRKVVPVIEEDEEIIVTPTPKRGRTVKKTAATPMSAYCSFEPEETMETQERSSSKRDLSMPFYERYLMTVEEASAYFHIGSKKMGSLIHEHPKAKWHLLSGNRRMIKKNLFEQWLDEQSEI